MLIVFFVVPFATMIAVSFFQRDPAGFYTPAFVFDNYARFLSLFFGKRARLLADAGDRWSRSAASAIAFPFTYLLTRWRAACRCVWLVGLLSVLSLSEVIIGFAWSTLFSRTAGITNLFVSLGLMERAEGAAAELRRGADRHGLSGAALYGAGALPGAGRGSTRRCPKRRARLAPRRSAPSSTSSCRRCATPSSRR